MAYSLSPWLKPRFFITGTNRPLAGGLMYTYKAGTTENATTYSNDSGTTNTNPIVLDSDGQCDLYLDDAVSYRIILKNAAGVTQFDKDRIASLGSTQVQSFNSVAALRLRSGTTIANAAKTLGYYAAGDGGGNSFYWDGTSTSTDNGGTIIKPTAVSGAGRWLAVDTSHITPEIFGSYGDGVSNDYLALQRALNLGKPIYLAPSKVYATETGLVTVSPYQRIVGASTGFSTDSTRGSWIKYTGTTNTGALIMCAAPNHGFVLEDVTLDCNDKIYYGLWLKSLAGQSLQMPSLNRCNYRGYLRAGLVLGSSSDTTLENGALQMCTITHQSFWGGGASAPDTTKVYGILINAQNCEFATMIGMYFDPFTSVGGGPYINHYNHIKGVSGGLNITGMVTTRATGYAIQIVADSSLIVNGWRCEDIYVVNYPTSAGFPSNPILIENLDHRAGLADGTGDAIVLKYSGNQLCTVRNCRVTGNIAIGGTVAKSATIKDIIYRAGDVSPFAVGSTTITAPVVAIADLEATAGQRTLYNPNAVETWQNGATPIYKNNKGSLSYIKGLSGTNVQCNNLSGALYFLTTTSVATVTFATAETDTNYRVLMTVNGVTGAAAAGSNRVKSIVKTINDFTVTLEAAPGAGCDTTFAWMIIR
jgi:hypothetical protein